jgi:hypothetical protein
MPWSRIVCVRTPRLSFGGYSRAGTERGLFRDRTYVSLSPPGGRFEVGPSWAYIHLPGEDDWKKVVAAN